MYTPNKVTRNEIEKLMVLLGTYPKWINLKAKEYPIIFDKIILPKDNK